MATERRRRQSSWLIAGLANALVALSVGASLVPGATYADSMRCGSRLVKEGDTIEKVRETCGEPAKQERTWIQRQPRFELGGQEYSFPGREDVPVDVWTYDFGPHKLKQKVRFVDGEVDSIVPLGKGK